MNTAYERNNVRLEQSGRNCNWPRETKTFKKLCEATFQRRPENVNTGGGGSYRVSRISFSTKKDATTKEKSHSEILNYV